MPCIGSHFPRDSVRERLAGLIERVEERVGSSRGDSPESGRIGVFSPISDSDHAAPVLETGAIHEWFGEEGARGEDWLPPLGALVDLARRALSAQPDRWALWIGRRCWPYPAPRGSGPDPLGRSLFVDSQDPDARLWAIDLALRSAAVGVVIADGSDLTMAATRRLQLAAASGRGAKALGLLARPAWEARQLSAARTRWRITPARSESGSPRWTIELLRRKGVRPAREAAPRFGAQWDHETGAMCVVCDVLDRSAAPEGSATRRTA
jgi:protein ImuA